jgi:heme-degrading monooxygenase HmoA
MYIKTVTFEVLAEAKETFAEKIRQDIASMKTFAGCLQSECWVNEKKATIDFQLVSKWQEKKDFQAWLKRPEHLQKHREAYQAEKEGRKKPSIVVNKTGQEYRLFDDSVVSSDNA